jgi:3-hydroxyacyl-CoA dehydrogenase
MSAATTVGAIKELHGYTLQQGAFNPNAIMNLYNAVDAQYTLHEEAARTFQMKQKISKGHHAKDGLISIHRKHSREVFANKRVVTLTRTMAAHLNSSELELATIKNVDTLVLFPKMKTAS